ncbi:MAG: hypothetical protein GWO83_01095 [Bacteroidia bacterium]|nr:hypothetical protein [Bacteroidia bacterium]
MAIDLAVFDRVEMSETMRQRVFAEATSILLDLGAHLVWRDGPSNFQAYAPRGEIQIILSKSRPERWGLPANIMGAVVPVSDRSRRMVFVFPAEVARLVGLPAPSKLPYRAVENRRLAKALGRVIAHELVHAIAPKCQRSQHQPVLPTTRTTMLQRNPTTSKLYHSRFLRCR